MTAPVSNYLIMGNQGENSRLTVFDRHGKPAEGVVWANPDTREMGTVSDYRAMGYVIVQPSQVETLDGGTFRTEKAEFGVMFEFDKKADRLTTKGQMTLMYASDAVRRQMLDQQRAMQDLYSRRGAKKEVLRGGADRGGAELETEQQAALQPILAD